MNNTKYLLKFIGDRACQLQQAVEHFSRGEEVWILDSELMPATQSIMFGSDHFFLLHTHHCIRKAESIEEVTEIQEKEVPYRKGSYFQLLHLMSATVVGIER